MNKQKGAKIYPSKWRLVGSNTHSGKAVETLYTGPSFWRYKQKHTR